MLLMIWQDHFAKSQVKPQAPGSYTVEYTFITSKDECIEYCENNDCPVENPETYEVPGHLGEGGEFDMTYEVSFVK